MNKSLTLLALCLLFCIGKDKAQSFSPISVTGYNFDAVAEATTAAANTTGQIDGSNYVLYSAAYGALYNITSGLPNNGLVTSGGYTFQLGSYTANNMCLTTPTITTDSLMFSIPASYSGLSLLCFSTEGNGNMDVTIRFTDNTTQTFTNQALVDWFQTGGVAVLNNYDRINRTSGIPTGTSINAMFALNFPVLCANRSKLIKNVKFKNNNLTTFRNCIMAISGAAMPTYTSNVTPVSCSGGSNGSAVIIPSGGIGPFTYTWSSTPAQTGATGNNLSVGVYSVTSQDAGLCPVITTVTITQSLIAQPALGLSANISTVCAGTTVSLSASGASTYTWNTSSQTSTLNVVPASTTIYTVGGLTNVNCYRTASITIVVNPLPVITFTTPASICINAAPLSLSAAPTGGSFNGQGVVSNMFSPNTAGVGTKTISYAYTDANGCVGSAINTLVVNAKPVLTFTLSPASLCTNSSTLNLVATPVNGTFTGTGVNGLVYSPSVAGAGPQTVSYTYTDANNCTSVATSTVMINTMPGVSFQTTKKLYCKSNGSVYLNAQPSGGIFTGPATSTAGVFSPTAAAVGVVTVVYTYTDMNQCSNQASFVATVSACSGITENAENTSLLIYPNPSNGVFTLKAEQATHLTLVNELGQVISQIKLDESNTFLIQLTDLSTGIYFINGESDGRHIRQKIIVTK